jgi:hypothetical protein
MAYPASPPTIEAAVAIRANCQARCGAASTIGTSIASGGIGNTELSRNATTARARVACGPAACVMVQS